MASKALCASVHVLDCESGFVVIRAVQETWNHIHEDRRHRSTKRSANVRTDACSELEETQDADASRMSRDGLTGLVRGASCKPGAADSALA